MLKNEGVVFKILLNESKRKADQIQCDVEFRLTKALKKRKS